MCQETGKKEAIIVKYSLNSSGLYLPYANNYGYGGAGASQTKRALKGFRAQSGSPVDDIDNHNLTLRQRTRMLYMAAPIAASAIKANRTNVIGIGLQPKSRIDREALGMSAEAAEAWQKNTEAEFALWAENKRSCDSTGLNDFYAIQQLALMSWLMSGDVFGLIKRVKPSQMMPYSLRIHLIEADRVSTPTTGNLCTVGGTEGRTQNGNRIHDGIEVDSNGAVTAYYICNTYPYSRDVLPGKWERIVAYGKNTGLPNIVHVMDSERPDQYRGVSYLAQIIEPLLQIRRLTESELMAAMVESFFSAFILTKTPEENPMNETNPHEKVSRDPNDYEMGAGQINFLLPDEDVKFSEPKRPGNNFQPFMRTICEQMGAALEIPADLLLKSFNSSYSASRAALMEAWKAFKMRREWFTYDFCLPIYEVWMSEAVALGRIQAPGFFTDPLRRAAYLGSEWIGPSQGQLDPVKEITAEILACQEAFSTREQSTIRLNGGQWDVNADQLSRENEKLAAAQKEPPPQEKLYNAVKDALIESYREEKTREEKSHS